MLLIFAPSVKQLLGSAPSAAPHSKALGVSRHHSITAQGVERFLWLQHPGRLEVCAKGAVKYLEQVIEVPRPLTVDRFLRLQMGIERDAVAAGPKDLTVDVLSCIAGEEHYDRRDVGRVHGRPLDGTAGSETYLLGKVGRDGVGHTRGRAGHDRIAGDVVLGERCAQLYVSPRMPALAAA